MPSKIWNLRNINVGGTNPNRLWWDEDRSALPAQTTSVTGWTVGKTGANNYSPLFPGVETASWSTTVAPASTPLPAVDTTYAATAVYTPPTLLSDGGQDGCISTIYEYNGSFPAGNWVFAYPVISVSNSANGVGELRMRVFKGARNGTAWSGVTELTSAVVTSALLTNITTTVAQTATLTWAAPAFRLNNEFLICKLAWRISTQSGSNGSDVLLRWGTGATMTSPNFRKRSYNTT